MELESSAYTGYWLFYAQRCVQYAFSEILRKHCLVRGKTYEVTPPQWGMLSLLYKNEGMTIGAISQKRGVDAPTMTGIVKRLEQSGLVERVHDRQDRRVVKVYLTDEGRDITASLFPVLEVFNAEMLHDFSPEEQATFMLQLQRIIANLSTSVEGAGDRFGLLPSHLFVSALEREQIQDTEQEEAHE